MEDTSNQRLESDAFGDRRHGQCGLGSLTVEPTIKESVSENLQSRSLEHASHGASSDRQYSYNGQKYSYKALKLYNNRPVCTR